MDNQAADSRNILLSYSGLRISIGIIGLLMPWFVRLGGYLQEKITASGTVSAYYYTGMRDVFVGTLILVGVLLAFYRTPRKRDQYVAVFTGLAAICIGIFPMDPVFPQNIKDDYFMPEDAKLYIQDHYFPHGQLGIHNYAVTVFFGLGIYLVANSFKNTTKYSSNEQITMTEQKVKRNRIYRICAFLMLLSGVGIEVLSYLNGMKRYENLHLANYIFFPESLAISSFAFAWLVKGQLIYRDTAPRAADLKMEKRNLLLLLSLPVSIFLIGWYLTAQNNAF
jgi:hypothetical protein